MKHTDFGSMACPIARSLGKVGEWWSILILRDAFYGLTRFDEFEKSLKIAPNMLTRRLSGLVEGGLMERRQYSTRPPRFEYILTEKGRVLAERVRARHRLVVDFLRAVGVPAEAAEADAEGIEHYVSEVTLKAFAQFLKAHGGYR